MSELNQPEPGSAALKIESQTSDEHMKNTEELKEGSTRNALMASMSQGIASLFRNSTL